MFFVFLFKQKTAYDMRISDWSSDVCSSDLQRTNRSSGDGGWGQIVTSTRIGKDDMGPDPPCRCVQPTFGKNYLTIVPSCTQIFEWIWPRLTLRQIGRASCRERVCQYV